jgi:two-component system, NtrC family, sensor kinase
VAIVCGLVNRLPDSKQPLQIHDLMEYDLYKQHHPDAVALVELAGARTLLVVPILKDADFVGVIRHLSSRRSPFWRQANQTSAEFCAQAVIAIENARLLNELRQSLQQQTATQSYISVDRDRIPA